MDVHIQKAQEVKNNGTNAEDGLAELFYKAQDGQNQAYWLLVTAEELRDELKEIADNPTVCGVRDLEAALDFVAWLHNAAENIESEFESLSDSIRCLEVIEMKAEIAASEPKAAPPSPKTALSIRKVAPPKARRRRRARSPASNAA